MSAETEQARTDADHLEEEIERTRDELVDTVDAIVDRVDPSRVAHRTTEQAKRDAARTADHAKEVAADVGDQASAYYEQHRDELPRIIAGALLGGLLAFLVARRRRGGRR